MSDVELDRAGQWLHAQRRTLAEWHRDGPPDGVEELADRALAGVDALAAVGAISEESAASWRDELVCAAEGRERDVAVPDEIRHSAEALATELLAAIPADLEADDDMSFERFEGAIELLGSIGAVDPAEWTAALDEQTGEAEDEEDELGGSEVELQRVVQGPAERRNGHRLIAALRFSDGVSFLIEKDDRGPRFEGLRWLVTDDLGTDYDPSGASGGAHDEHVTFSTAIPSDARWIELAHAHDSEVVFRVTL